MFFAPKSPKTNFIDETNMEMEDNYYGIYLIGVLIVIIVVKDDIIIL